MDEELDVNRWLPKNLKYYREQLHMTQDQLAKALDIPRGTLANYEAGRTEPSFEMAIRIAKELDIDLLMLTSEPSYGKQRRVTVTDEEYSMIRLYRGVENNTVRKIVRGILEDNQKKG